jgi:hypothetical protein
MIKLSSHLGFTFEQCDHLPITQHDVGLKYLEGYTTANPGLARAVNSSHSSNANQRINLIFIEGAPHQMVRVLQRELAAISPTETLVTRVSLLALGTVFHSLFLEPDLHHSGTLGSRPSNRWFNSPM